MSGTKFKVITALFDIKPVDETGQVDVERIEKVVPVVYLAQPSRTAHRQDLLRELQVSPVNKTPSEKVNKKAPTNATNIKLVNSVRAAYGTVSPGLPSIDSTAEPIVKSSETVDSQKPRSSEVVGFVDGTGFAPVGSWMAIPNWHYTPSKVKQSYQEKLISQDELEKYLNSNFSIKKELRTFGAKIVSKPFGGVQGRPRLRPISGIWDLESRIRKENPNSKFKIYNSENNKEYQTILAQINEKIISSYDEVLANEPKKIDPISLEMVAEARSVVVSSELESWINYAKAQSAKRKVQNFKKTAELVIQVFRNLLNKRNVLVVAVTGFVLFAFMSLGNYGTSLKNEVLKSSNSAVVSLQEAKANLQTFDFVAASGNFEEAYKNFSEAGKDLNFLGASLTALFVELPGASSLKSAKNLVEAGKLLAEAGESTSAAIGSLSQTSSILKLANDSVNSSGQTTIKDLKKSLLSSSRNLAQAETLLLDVSPDILPEDKKEAFAEFQSKLPEFEKLISSAIDYANFLGNFVGSNGTTKKYLVLFQNNSELRPTGGFPGTYGVVTFKDGRLEGFFVDDIYNLDGQLKENIVPPFPLQHITPTWGMRDSNWFIDFSLSAQKIMEFFKKETGYEVDGVITLSPQIISDILKVVGPIEMPEYELLVTSDNFISAIQEEVEYGDNRQQPKKVLVDMAPQLLERIYSSDPVRWLDTFNVFVTGLDKKEILMYFKDLSLENFVAEKGFGGLLYGHSCKRYNGIQCEGDYLMVTLSNIKGSKTDRVIDNHLKLHSKFEIPDLVSTRSGTGQNSKPTVTHKLTITRKHNGGSSKYGFYNKQNPAFVRVLVPEGAKLVSISGNSDPNFKPLISYTDSEFNKDDDLFEFESSFKFDKERNVWTFSESGQTGFAFWLITNPGEEKTAELEYTVSINNTTCSLDTPCPKTIYIQKQPGLKVDSFEFKVNGAYIYNGGFDKDLELRFKANH